VERQISVGDVDSRAFVYECKVKEKKNGVWKVNDKGKTINFAGYINYHYINRDLGEFLNEFETKRDFQIQFPFLLNEEEFLYISAFKSGFVRPKGKTEDGTRIYETFTNAKEATTYALKVGYASTIDRLKHYLNTGGGFHRGREDEENPCHGIRLMYLIHWKQPLPSVVENGQEFFKEPGFKFLDGTEGIVRKKRSKMTDKHSFMLTVLETCFQKAIREAEGVRTYSYKHGILTGEDAEKNNSEFYLASRRAVEAGFPFFFKLTTGISTRSQTLKRRKRKADAQLHDTRRKRPG